MQATRLLHHDLTAVRATQTVRLVMAKTLSKGIFLCLLLVITLAPVPYGAADVSWETLFQSVVFSLGAVWVVQALLAGSWNFREYGLFAPACALIVLVLLQTVPFGGSTNFDLSSGAIWHAISADPFETWRFAIKLSSLVLLGALLFAFTTTRRRLSALVHCVMLVGVGSAVFGILRQASETAGIAFIPTSLRIGQGYAQFVNSNHFAFLMEMSLGLVMGVVLGGGVRRDRILIYVAAAIPMWTALALSTSRGGILAILSEVGLLALIVTSVLNPVNPRKANGIKAWAWRASRSIALRSIIIAVLLLTMAASVVWIGGSPLANRLDTIEREIVGGGPGGVRRIDIWGATWQLIKAHPIAGVGFAGYWVAIAPYHSASGESTPREAHNDYLELLASGGIIGFAICAVFFLILLRRIGVQLRQPDPVRRAMCLGAVVGLFGIAVHSLVDFGLHLASIAAVCVALMVIATTSINETGSPRGSMQLRKVLIEKSKRLKRGARMLKGWS